MKYIDRYNDILKQQVELEKDISTHLAMWADGELRDRVAHAVLQDTIPLEKLVTQFKKDLIKNALEKCGGSRHLTAKVLRVSRSGLILMCSKYLEISDE